MRAKGRSIASCTPSPGTWMHRTSLKMQFTLDSSQNWSTEMRVSVKDGTQRTSRMMIRRHMPDESRASAGRSPMHLTRCGLPSMPAMVSLHGRRLIKSSMCG